MFSSSAAVTCTLRLRYAFIVSLFTNSFDDNQILNFCSSEHKTWCHLFNERRNTESQSEFCQMIFPFHQMDSILWINSFTVSRFNWILIFKKTSKTLKFLLWKCYFQLKTTVKMEQGEWVRTKTNRPCRSQPSEMLSNLMCVYVSFLIGEQHSSSRA